MTRDEPNGEVNLEAMLPDLRAGLRLAAERRAGQAFPGLRLWKVILGGVLLGGISLWFVAEPPLLRTFGCAGAVLALGAWLLLGWWWSIQVKRRMREVLLDPRR